MLNVEQSKFRDFILSQLGVTLCEKVRASPVELSVFLDCVFIDGFSRAVGFVVQTAWVLEVDVVEEVLDMLQRDLAQDLDFRLTVVEEVLAIGHDGVPVAVEILAEARASLFE